ncbi:cadherin-like domain-containing protein [bacterium]|nr:cadherin-like domain-containing protein [bacterium]MBU1882673.1 cadherin-like domain-containing protein [bacterium]
MFSLIRIFLLLTFFNISILAAIIGGDNFSSGLNNWTGTGVTVSSGQMNITRDNTATKIYYLGGSYGNQLVTIDLQVNTVGGWENSGGSKDYLNINTNGTVYTQSYVNGTYSFPTITVLLPSSGNLTITINPNTTGNGENVNIDNVVISSTAPTANPDTFSVFNTASISGNVITNDTGSSIGVSSWNSPSHGILSATTTAGTFTYTPTTGYIGSDSFDYTITDSGGNTSTATVTITVNPPYFSISDLNITEGSSGYYLLNVPVTLSSLDGNTHTVDYTTSDIDTIATTSSTPGDYNTSSGTLTFDAATATQYIPVYINGDKIIENDEKFSITLSNPTNTTIANTTAIVTILDDDDIGYCQTNSLSNGFHIADPFNDINKSIEIYCYDNKDYIALPNKNNSNNFVFSNNTLTSTNYYQEAIDHSTSFQAIEINAYTLKVKTKATLRLPQTVSTFKTMGSSFSNINLTATPFAIDWDNTSISNCTQSKLRTAYYGQDVKINSLDYDNKAICNIDYMQLKLLDDYHYLVYEGEEVLKSSCKTMAEAVPSTVLDSASIKGSYWISPSLHDRTYDATDITSTQRPIVAYCWYQTDLNWVWTFTLAMDGKVTNKKSDLTNKADTCSQFGLLPFVPNSEDTFERVRAFLYDKKSQWVNYTGTINEKYKVFNGSENYYLSSEYNSIIWPYGSFGLYFPANGDHLADGTAKEWGGSQKTPDYMSGSPMHNIKSITTDYDRVNNDEGNTARDYYSWGNYSSTDTITTPTNAYTYADTMGAKGWVTILGSSPGDLNKTDEWFISRTGAGDNFSNTGNYPYYEPNGNYTAYAWVNFLFDSNGRVRHMDDYNAKYSYYDYMCMAEDNYDFTTRYGLLDGPFKAIEHSVPSGNELTTLRITTKIVNDPLSFDIILLNNALSAIEPDKNTSVGIFLDDTYMSGSAEISQDIHYFGDIKLDGSGSLNSLKSSGRFEIPTSTWPSGINKWPYADKRLFFKFKYCSNDTYEWTDCWNHSGNTATCKTGSDSICKTADSDDFAMRPDKFDFSISGSSPYKAGVAYDITFSAKDSDDNNTLSYNESVPFTYTETKSGCKLGDYNSSSLTTIPFVDGYKIMNLAYSEAGVINVKLKETQGSEFALTDANDTADSQRYITSYDQNWTYTPDHFSLTSSFSNKGNGFTYISNDLNMSADLNITIVAKSETDSITENYNSACYAKTTDYAFSYTPLIIYPNSTLPQIKYKETYSDINGTVLINTTWNINGLPNTVFSTDNNGTGKLNFKINFGRSNVQVVDPFLFNFKDINVTDTDTIDGNITLNQNVTFLYGRTHAPRYRFPSNMGNAIIYYEVYCDSDGNTTLLPNGTATTESVDELNWYNNTNHNINSDGNITTVTERKSSPRVALNNLTSTNPENANIIYDISMGYPYKTTMQDTASEWLIYNKYDNTATANEFEVEFYNPAGNWTGVHETNTTTDSNASGTTSKRIFW